MIIGLGGAFVFYVSREKEERKQIKEERKTQVAGRGVVGGPFKLQGTDGKVYTEKDLIGNWTLMYFGFTYCPDVCPDELEKLSAALTALDADIGPIVRPLFISVDPKRDTPERMAEYTKGMM